MRENFGQYLQSREITSEKSGDNISCYPCIYIVIETSKKYLKKRSLLFILKRE